MTDETTPVSILRITDSERVQGDDEVVREFPFTIILNGEELATTLCTPEKLKYLAIGFLASEGLIRSREDIRKITLNEGRGSVRVETENPSPLGPENVFKRFITSGCGKGTALYSYADALNQTKAESNVSFSADGIFRLMKDFQERSRVFRETGGVHSAALSDGKSILVFSEDIGRHNAVDKVFGECLWEGIPTKDSMLLTSGRVSSEILFKIVKRKVPVIVSKSAPTDIAVRTARELGITLVGFARSRRMNVYASEWRIVD